MKELHVKALQDLATGLANNGWFEAASIATSAAQFIATSTADPADMATAAAQGFRDGQAAEHPDTARLRFMFDCVQKDSDPYTDEVTALVEKEFPTQADIKTFDHFQRVVDIARGAV